MQLSSSLSRVAVCFAILLSPQASFADLQLLPPSLRCKDRLQTGPTLGLRDRILPRPAVSDAAAALENLLASGELNHDTQNLAESYPLFFQSLLANRYLSEEDLKKGMTLARNTMTGAYIAIATDAGNNESLEWMVSFSQNTPRFHDMEKLSRYVTYDMPYQIRDGIYFSVQPVAVGFGKYVIHKTAYRFERPPRFGHIYGINDEIPRFDSWRDMSIELFETALRIETERKAKLEIHTGPILDALNSARSSLSYKQTLFSRLTKGQVLLATELVDGEGDSEPATYLFLLPDNNSENPAYATSSTLKNTVFYIDSDGKIGYATDLITMPSQAFLDPAESRRSFALENGQTLHVEPHTTIGLLQVPGIRVD